MLDVEESADIPIVVTWPDPTTPPRVTFPLRFEHGGPHAELSDIGFEGILLSYVDGTESPPDLPLKQSIPVGGPPTPTGAAGLKQWIGDAVSAGDDAHITIDAHTSFTRDEDADLDQRLAERRLAVARAIILDARPNATFDHALAHGHAIARTSSEPGAAEHDVTIVEAAASSAGSGVKPREDIMDSWIDLPVVIDGMDPGGPAPHLLQTKPPISTLEDLRKQSPMLLDKGTYLVDSWPWFKSNSMPLPPNNTSPIKEVAGTPATPATPAKFQVRLRLDLVYPAATGDPDHLLGHGQPSPPKLPVVVIAHGAAPAWKQNFTAPTAIPAGEKPTVDATLSDELTSYRGFGYLQEALAEAGIVSVSVDGNVANFFSCALQTRAKLIVEAVRALAAAHAAPAGLLAGRLDLKNVALVGHSAGGDGAVQAARDMAAAVLPDGVKVVCAIAPTDLKGTDPSRISLKPGDTGFFYLLYGALDGDVTGYGGASSGFGTGFRHYDRATCEKASTYLAHCSHAGFNHTWRTQGNDTNDTACLEGPDHETLATEYIVDLMRWRLKGEVPLATRFDGRQEPPNSLKVVGAASGHAGVVKMGEDAGAALC